ncbi:6-phosphogluconate dehydrogenase, decarboxylating [Candidatus Blochmanniella floridana]|uniref:6-phosphogluconate dehydrogenase, decarboxylating n=1 Tax=Blochmanniella floridana TaxID=203907 RepID=Q7VRX5_BLOFL|nr:6-phosphogluconate dehydrogenase, decarboxylating [Candidatus Blochmannia floridanus]
MFKQQEVGVIGMGIMGQNLALNIENKGYRVSIYNRSPDKTNIIIKNNPTKNLIPYFSIEQFIFSLKKPRVIFLMITAGVHVDHIIQVLSNYLEIGDILIDGGNSFYQDTVRRDLYLSEKKINFIGLGISGGEEGALKGPSLMPGGSQDAFKIVESLLKKIAARFNDNEICMEYIGPNGSGHYVKMMHNGMEYGDMQIISEIYFFLKMVLHLTAKQLGKIFSDWNMGELSSYLIEITSHILMKSDNNQYCVLDYILDVADNKGTGLWSSKDALDLGVPSTMITESVFARYLSTLKNQRIQASKVFSNVFEGKVNFDLENIDIFVEKARKALYLSKIILYAQGFYQLKISSMTYHWNLNYQKIAKIFRAGCIIRSNFLQEIINIYSKTPKIENLLLDSYCVNIINNYQQDLRDIVTIGIDHGIPMPALSAAISYYDGFRSLMLPANLIQAQRDCFGSHTYKRIDKSGVFHTRWLSK